MSLLPAGVVDWEDLRASAPLPIWLDAAARIARAHDLPVVEPVMYASGSDVVVRVGEAVVKLSAPRWAAEIAAEADLLARVQGRLPLDTPRLLARGALEGWPYVVMSVVEGEPLGEVWPALDHEARLQLAVEIGALLEALGRLPLEEEAAARWPGFLAQMRDGATERLGQRRRPLAPEWLPRVAPFLAGTTLSERPLAWMHTELMGDHLLVQARGGRFRLAAALDFADGRVGHPFYEIPAVAEFLFRGEPGLLGALLLRWGLPEERLGPELSRELCAWGLIHRFGDVARALHAAGPPEPPDLEALAERLYRF